LNHILSEMDLQWIPITKAWQFNERHYGGLTGLNKAKTMEKYGEEKVMEWRRSWDKPPPTVSSDSEYHPSNDARYSNLTFPTDFTETLKTTLDRVWPYYEHYVCPQLRQGKTVIVSAHGNSLRALVKQLDDIDESVVPNLNIPTGIPLIYEFDVNMNVIQSDKAMSPLRGRYLGNPEEVKAKIDGVSHAVGNNKLAFQDYFVIPTGAENFKEAMRMGTEIYHTFGKILKKHLVEDGLLSGNEGDSRIGCELIVEAIEKAGYEGKCSIGLDVTETSSESKGKNHDLYDLDFKYDGNTISGKALSELQESLATDCSTVTMEEDLFEVDDWENWSEFGKKTNPIIKSFNP